MCVEGQRHSQAKLREGMVKKRGVMNSEGLAKHSRVTQGNSCGQRRYSIERYAKVKHRDSMIGNGRARNSIAMAKHGVGERGHSSAQLGKGKVIG